MTTPTLTRILMAALMLPALMLPGAAFAHDGMHVNDAYARSTNPMVASVFLQLENHRAVACTLRGAASDAAERVELHTHVEQDGVMSMRRIEDGIAVAAGGVHALDRGGDHVMLLGLTQPLAEGDRLTLTLDFGDCGLETVEAVVDNARDGGAHGAAPGDHAGH